MNKKAMALCILGTVAVVAGLHAEGTAERPDAIYFGGPIVTMIRDGDRVDALAIRDGRIIAAGSRDEVMATRSKATRLVDLQGHALMPGFIDAHSHVVQQALKFSVVNLDPHPIGDVKSIADIQRKLRQRIAEQQPGKGQWVFGWGYDDTGLEEMRHPTREDLDAVSKEHPILLMHISNHLMAANSRALEIAGITAATPDPEGGKVQRMAGSREPNGVLEETALFAMLAKVPSPAPERAMEMLTYGLARYAEAGITTAQDGASTRGMLKLLQKADESGQLPIDVVAYPLYKVVDEKMIADIAGSWRTPRRYRVGGIKLAVDGSIQGYTAYLSKPYYVQPGAGGEVKPDACDSDAGARMLLGPDAGSPDVSDGQPGAGGDHRGYANMTLEEVSKYLRMADAAGVPVLVHTNGDAATDILIDAVRQVRGDLPRPDLRTVIIHAQTMRDDQLNFAASQGLVPSFFPIHVQFWGDRHRDIFLGPERAARIDPARSALDRGMKITLHHDAPVAGNNILDVVSSAVNRLTTSGQLLGPSERITSYEAFRAVTKDAAWQNFEEHRKGTLEPGKVADMVILSQDPLSGDPATIAAIQVLETIKDGQTVFRRGE